MQRSVQQTQIIHEFNMQVTSPTAKSHHQRIPSEKWELMRPVVSRLYQTEKKSLKEVMDILERDHNFKATVKMYKSRIWKWGLDKKLKSDEVLAILILKREREAEGHRSVYTIRDQVVDMANIERYTRRNPSLVRRFHEGHRPSHHTMREVRARTPPASPARTLAPSSELYRGEEALLLMRNYISESFCDGSWVYEYNISCNSCQPGDRSEELFERLVASFALVNRSRMRGDTVNISDLLGPAFGSLQEIVKTASPVFVIRGVCLLWYLDQKNDPNLLRIVLDYLTKLTKIVLKPGHVLAPIWHILGTTEFPSYYELSTRLYSMLAPLLEDKLGPANYLTSMLYGDHIDCVLTQGTPENSLQLATTYLKRVNDTGQQHAWLTELAITRTALMCAAKEAEGEIGEAIRCLETLKSYALSEEQEAMVNIQLGNYSYNTGDLGAAIGSFREATRLAIHADGDERLLLTCLANLESAMSKAGRSLQASSVHRYRMKRLADFATESSEFTARTPECPRDPQPDVEIAPKILSTAMLGSAADTPSWLWEDNEEFFTMQEARRMDTSHCPNLETSSGDWSGSITESQPETVSSHLPSVSPMVVQWEDSPKDSADWGERCYN